MHSGVKPTACSMRPTGSTSKVLGTRRARSPSVDFFPEGSMTMTLLQLIERTVRMLEGGAPKDLARSLRTVLDFEDEAVDLYSVDDLGDAMRADDQADGVSLIFGRLLWRWDHVPYASWTDGTTAQTEERRS